MLTKNSPDSPKLPDSRPRIDIEDTPQGRLFKVSGTWTVASLSSQPVWRTLMTQLDDLRQTTARLESSSASHLSHLGLGLSGPWTLLAVEQLDYLGAQVLWNAWGQRWPTGLQLLPEQRHLFENIQKFTVEPAFKPAPAWGESLRLLGTRWLNLIDHIVGLLQLFGQLWLDIGRFIRHPKRGPWRDFSGHLYHFGATALHITALVGFLIGVVLAYLIAQQLRQFGADAFIVNILGISLVRELGPVLAAILLAGRSGSAITAQIGVMRVTQELDAMRVMGILGGFRLVMPRVLALALVMPLISVWTTLAGLFGGMLAAEVSMGVTFSFFINALPGAVKLSNLILATAKSVVFGGLIGLVACHYGLRIQPNTESLGQGTTASVVTSITVVLLVDALFAVLFKNLGI